MVKFLRADKKAEISNFIGWFCLKYKLLEQKIDTAVSCPDTEGLWKVSAKSELWQRGLSLIYLYSSRGKERGVRDVILPAFCCYKNICKLETQEPKARCKINLPDICTTSKPFISEKMRASMIGWWRGRIQKSTKKCPKTHKILTLTSPKSSLKNAVKAGVFSTASLTIWL